jgi:lipid-A-disaccharide synthase
VTDRAYRIDALDAAIVACEASGDTLGAGLIEALSTRVADLQVFGMAGDRMRAAGCVAWHDIEEHSVMGLAEVLPHLPRLLKLRRTLAQRIIERRPDVFIGIDSPDFNLPIAAAVRRAGIPTIQYVSPQVWAWRQSRVAKIRAAVDRVLCVLPFEVDFYAEHAVPATFVGHPLADAIPLSVSRSDARMRLGLDVDGEIVTLLPGSRGSELGLLARPFLETASWLRARRPGLRFIVALANATAEHSVARALEGLGLDPPPRLVEHDARTAITAANVCLTASGTATLEALLLKRPMVVAHRVSPVTYWIVRKLGVQRLAYFSLPNLLAGEQIVPEFVQRDVRPDVLGPALTSLLDRRDSERAWLERAEQIHRSLRCGANEAAAAAVLELHRAVPVAR